MSIQNLLAERKHYTEGARDTVALVIPLYNEEAVLPILLDHLYAFRRSHPEVVKVIFIDDGSTDATSQIVRSMTSGRSGYVILRFSRNFGHQIAVTAGMHFVEEDAAIILDADLQDPLPVAARMIEKWREGFDVVYGVRKHREGESWFKLATARMFYRVFRWMTDLDIPLDTGDFRLVSRRVLDAYRQIGEQQPFIRGLISWLGFNQIGIEYERGPRAAGRTKYSLRKMLRLAFDSFTSFSDKPLRLAIALGLFSTLVSVAGLFWVLAVKYVFHTAVTGWASMAVILFFFGGVQVLFLGVVGLYLDRVYEEVKGRPRYLVQDVWQSEPADPEAQAANLPE